MTVRTNDVYGSLPIPQRTGHAFLDWYTARSGGSWVTSTSLCPAGDHTLYAHWTSAVLPEKYERVVALQIGRPYIAVDRMRQPIDDPSTTPMARNNRTMLPIRFAVEYFGATVDYLPRARGWKSASKRDEKKPAGVPPESTPAVFLFSRRLFCRYYNKMYSTKG